MIFKIKDMCRKLGRNEPHAENGGAFIYISEIILNEAFVAGIFDRHEQMLKSCKLCKRKNLVRIEMFDIRLSPFRQQQH